VGVTTFVPSPMVKRPTMKPRTKAEQAILVKVRTANEAGALAGLSTAPGEANFGAHAFRFLRRLNDRGELVWMPRSTKFGAGWALRECVDDFYRAGYRPE